MEPASELFRFTVSSLNLSSEPLEKQEDYWVTFGDVKIGRLCSSSEETCRHHLIVGASDVTLEYGDDILALLEARNVADPDAVRHFENYRT